MSNCVHDNGEYCEVFSDKEVRQPCFETPLCEDYKEIVRCKDCKYWITKGWLTEGTNIKVCNRLECLEGCDSTCWDMEADDFCSRGERR